MKRITLLYTVLSLVALSSACKKFVAVPPPATSLSTPKIFADSALADAAVVGIYSSAIGGSSLFDGRLSAWGGLLSDELTALASNSNLVPFQENNLSALNTEINNMWRNPYANIYLANAVIGGLNTSSGLTPSAKAKLIAEAKLIRAWYNFYLVNLFGDIPLILTTDYNETNLKARTDAVLVYDQIVKDLQEAIQDLPLNYPNSERTRPNKTVARALLSRVLLYLNSYPAAETEATAVINTGTYTPLPSAASVFLKDSRETIWQWRPVNPSNQTADGSLFIPSNTTTIPAYTLSSNLIAAFESNDSRRTAWVGNNTVGGTPYAYAAKYKIRTSTTTTNVTEYNIMLRVSEMYLIRAEARVRQNKIVDGVADINVIRSRAGLPGLPSNLTQDQALTALEKERRMELFAERGHRWFDLKRTDRANAVLGSLKGSNWSVSDLLMPIPAQQLQLNPNLKQNANY